MLVANSATAIFFIAFFAYTFVGRRHIDHLARDSVTAKTQKFADPVVDIADKALKNKLVRTLLTDKQIAAFEGEIVEYRTNSRDYIGKLTGQRVPTAMRQFKNPLLIKIAQWKSEVRDYYDKVLGRLIWDLRIFAGSNMVAAVIATWLAYRPKGKAAKKTAWLSFLIFAAMANCVYMYIDSLSFFTILFNSYMGWWYPVLLVVAFIRLYLEYRGVPEKST